MKKLLILLLTTAIILVPSCIQHQTIYENQLKKKFPIDSFVQVLQKVKFIDCTRYDICVPKFETSIGSGLSLGTFEDGSIILTAEHVCRVDMPKEVKFKSGLFVKNQFGLRPAAIIHMVNSEDRSIDLCALYVPGLKTEGVGPSLVGPRVGEEVYALSAPVGIYHPPTVPILSGIYSGPIPDTSAMLTTIPAVGGSSGSAILNSHMKIVGVIFASHIGFHHASIATNHKETTNFIMETFKRFYRVFKKSLPTNLVD